MGFCYSRRMDIFSVLNYVGFTPANITPLVVVGVIAVFAVFRHTKPIRESLQDIRERFARLEGSLSGAFQAQSPISLKAAGIKALEESGLKKWVDDHKEELFAQCSPFDNPYDIQERAFQLFDQLHFGDFEENLKRAAFEHGWGIDIMKRIGGIYFRDLCLQAKNFKLEDLDKPSV